MLRRDDPPALHRVVVDVIHLWEHHLTSGDGLRMHSFLPDLVPARCLMGCFVVSELVQ
jgi:hypothetical protein